MRPPRNRSQCQAHDNRMVTPVRWGCRAHPAAPSAFPSMITSVSCPTGQSCPVKRFVPGTERPPPWLSLLIATGAVVRGAHMATWSGVGGTVPVMQQTRAAPLASLDAVLERITYANQETGYTVARVATDRSSDLLTVVGPLLGAQPGESLRLQGRWAGHPGGDRAGTGPAGRGAWPRSQADRDDHRRLGRAAGHQGGDGLPPRGGRVHVAGGADLQDLPGRRD